MYDIFKYSWPLTSQKLALEEFTDFTNVTEAMYVEKQSRGLDRTSLEYFETNLFDVNGDTTGQPTGDFRSPGSYVGSVCNTGGKFEIRPAPRPF